MAMRVCFSLIYVAALLHSANGQLKMQELLVYWNPSGPKAAATTFCADYAAAIMSATSDDAAAWLNLWSTTDTDKLEWHGPLGTPVKKGWTTIQNNTATTKGFTSFTCDSVWPTVADNTAGFVFTFTHPAIGNGQAISILDVITFDTNYKMSKLVVYWNPAGPKAEVTQFCNDYAAAILSATNDNAAAWLNLWGTQDRENLEWHGPLGTPVKAGWTDIQGNKTNTQGFSTFTCDSAWPTVDNFSAGFVFTLSHPGISNGTSIPILDVINFEKPTPAPTQTMTTPAAAPAGSADAAFATKVSACVAIVLAATLM